MQRTVKGFELLVEGHKQNEARLREALEQIVYADDQGYRAMISSTARAALSGETIQPMEYKIPVLPIDHEAEARIDRLVEQNRKPPADEDEFYARVMGHALKSKP